MVHMFVVPRMVKHFGSRSGHMFSALVDGECGAQIEGFVFL